MTAETVRHAARPACFMTRFFKVKLSTTILTYFGYALLVAFGYMRDFMSKYVAHFALPRTFFLSFSGRLGRDRWLAHPRATRTSLTTLSFSLCGGCLRAFATAGIGPLPASRGRTLWCRNEGRCRL